MRTYAQTADHVYALAADQHRAWLERAAIDRGSAYLRAGDVDGAVLTLTVIARRIAALPATAAEYARDLRDDR